MASLAMPLAATAGWRGTDGEDGTKKIVFVAGNRQHKEGDEHEWLAGCRVMAAAINANMPGYRAVIYGGGWPDDAAAFDQADSVVIYSGGAGGHPLMGHFGEFREVMERGVGLVCLHFAVEVPKGKPGNRFLDWMGGYFELGWSVNPYWTADGEVPSGGVRSRSRSVHELHEMTGERKLDSSEGKGSFVNSIGLKMRRIDPGSFRMGQKDGGDFDEEPVHKVKITEPFYMATTEVTNEAYERFDPWHRHLRGRNGFSSDNDEAVIFVSWEEARAFCRWLSNREGRNYRLPTEAEWEYACRAGTEGPFYTGDELPESYHKAQGHNRIPQEADLTVARTSPNPWGLFDMHGNIEEWCYDWYGPYRPYEQIDPVGREDGDFRVTRGGSHNTRVEHLRSANRHGTLPEDRHWLIGFRVVAAPLPDSEPLPPVEPKRWAEDVDQEPGDWSDAPDPSEPYFEGPKPYVNIPPGSYGPMYSDHNHDPDITWCPNGDLLAIWYSCDRETGRELTILGSRLRAGADQWEPAAPFWNAPDRNDHAPALIQKDGTLYHFNGLSAAQAYRKNLALVMRTSTDNGASWSKARLINPVRGVPNQPVASELISSEGHLMFTADWPWHSAGRSSALWVSKDNGRTWSMREGRIAGIHAALAQRKDGTLIAFGRASDINGRMAKSISTDMGRSWRYEAGPFPGIGGGQRSVLLRLQNGAFFFASFAKGMMLPGPEGELKEMSGLFAALSRDGGKTWPVRRLVTPGGAPKQADGGAWTREFTLSETSAEPKGYLAGIQTPDGLIHLISSKLYYSFNLAWLKARGKVEESR